MTEVISYAYAIARDTDGSLAEALSGLPGVAEAPVHLVRAGDRGAVVVAVSPVPEQDFQEARCARTWRIWSGWSRWPAPITG